MALINCTECGKEISDSAENCPHCGCKTSRGKTATQGKLLLINCIFIIGGLILGLYLVLNYAPELNEYNRYYNGSHNDFKNTMRLYEYLWKHDLEARMTICKYFIGIILLIGTAIHVLVACGKAREMVSESNLTAPVPEINDSVNTVVYIPPEKRCHDVCDKCGATGITAVCILLGTRDDQKLCPSCIRKYSAKIK